jgi:hypothetical protein
LIDKVYPKRRTETALVREEANKNLGSNKKQRCSFAEKTLGFGENLLLHATDD